MMTFMPTDIVAEYAAIYAQQGILYGATWVAVTSRTGQVTVGDVIGMLALDAGYLEELDMDQVFDGEPSILLLDEVDSAVSVLTFWPLSDESLESLSLNGEAISAFFDIDSGHWLKLAVDGEIVLNFNFPGSFQGSRPDALNAEHAQIGDALDVDPAAAMLALVELRTGVSLTAEYFTRPHWTITRHDG
jgi:hypothetical protein